MPGCHAGLSAGLSTVSPRAAAAASVLAGVFDGRRWAVSGQRSAVGTVRLRSRTAQPLRPAAAAPASYALTVTGGVCLASVAAQYPQLRFKAVVSYCAQARADTVAATRTPSAWFLCGNAVNADVSKAGAQANSAALAARGVPTPRRCCTRPRRCTSSGSCASASFTAARFRGLAAAFQAAGLVDAAMVFNTRTAGIAAQATAMRTRLGMRLQTCLRTRLRTRLQTLSAPSPAQQRSVVSQIAVVRAEHGMFSGWASRSLRCYAAHP